MSNTHIGTALKQRRKSLRVTQPELADLAGVHINTLYKIERGQGNPTIETIDRIAAVLGMELQLVIKTLNTDES